VCAECPASAVSLHRADRSFHRDQGQGVLTPRPCGAVRQISRGRTQDNLDRRFKLPLHQSYVHGPDDQGGHRDRATPEQYEQGMWPWPPPGMETPHPHPQRTQEASGAASPVPTWPLGQRLSFPVSLCQVLAPSYRSPAVSRVAQSVQCLTMDWTAGVRSPTEAEDFSSNLCVQTGSGAHPASYTMGTGALSPGVKRGRGVMLTTHPLLVPTLIKSRSYTSCHPNAPLWSVEGPLYHFTGRLLSV
jgi:hypothetical protein